MQTIKHVISSDRPTSIIQDNYKSLNETNLYYYGKGFGIKTACTVAVWHIKYKK